MLYDVRAEMKRDNGKDEPKEMTPTAWKMPVLMVKRGRLKVPFEDAGTKKPCVTTVIKMITILIKAKVLALANYFRQLHLNPESRYLLYLCNISIETQGVTDSQNKNNNHSSPIGQQTQNRHILQTRPDRGQNMWYRVPNYDSKRHHPTKCKSPLSNGNSNQARLSKTMLYRALKTVTPAQLTVDNNKADGPVHSDREDNEQNDARDETSLAECVRLPNYTGPNDRIGHIHEGRPQPGPWALALPFSPLMYIVAPGASSQCNGGSFDVCEEGHDGLRTSFAAAREGWFVVRRRRAVTGIVVV